MRRPDRPALSSKRLPKVAVALAATVMAAAAAHAAPPIASPTPAQSRAVTAAFVSVPPALRADVAAALPTLLPFVTTIACVQDDHDTQALTQRYIGSRGTNMFNGWAGANAPGKRMRHHDMAGCLTITRMQNWRRVALNGFSFDILFTADDSGESYLWPMVVHREPDGTWLLG